MVTTIATFWGIKCFVKTILGRKMNLESNIKYPNNYIRYGKFIRINRHVNFVLKFHICPFNFQVESSGINLIIFSLFLLITGLSLQIPFHFLYFIFCKALYFVPISYNNSWNIFSVFLFHFPKFPLLSCSNRNMAVLRGHLQPSSIFCFSFCQSCYHWAWRWIGVLLTPYCFPPGHSLSFLLFLKLSHQFIHSTIMIYLQQGSFSVDFYHWHIVPYYHFLHFAI